MANDLLELQNKILSNDYSDILVALNTPDSDFLFEYSKQGAQILNSSYGVLHLDIPLNSQFLFSQMGYYNVPKVYTTLDYAALDASGILSVQSQPLLGYKGRNVIIGFLDTGIDYTHPAFRNTDGSTRILSLWDQSIASNAPNLNFPYGTIYTRQQLNQALDTDEPFSLVPSIDTNGHGTALAGAAAGNNMTAEAFSGSAPEADIVVVKLKPAKQNLLDFWLVEPGATAFQETDILSALHFLVDQARVFQKPLVICLGLGTNQGGHGGKSPLSNTLNQISASSGICTVTAAGNEAGKGHHYYGKIEANTTTQNVEILVPENESGFMLELWASPPDLFSTGIVSPLGEVIPPIPARQNQNSRITFSIEKTVIDVIYEVVELSSGSQLILFRIQNPTPGIWTFRIQVERFFEGTFHLWLPITGFLRPETRFLNPNPDTTLTSPSNTTGTITVSNYDAVSGSLYINSSRGYTRMGGIKPDLAAPGVNITVPISVSEPDYIRAFSLRTGSSLSAGICAGAAALLFNWGLERRPPRYLSTQEIKSLMIRGATTSPDLLYPNREWGYGTLNLYQIFQSLM